ncbi:MAG: transmembrane sensor [Paraglaciecola sp.]|jgi:transmembrane sensor
MSNVYHLNGKDKRLEQVSEWIAKIDRGLSQAEKIDFQKWMTSSAENRVMLLEVAKLWDKMDVLTQLSEVFPHSTVTQKKHSLTLLGMAASLLLASILSIGLWQGEWLFSSKPVQQIVSTNVYSTSLGEHATFYLQDKTKVVLNTDSKIKITYTDKQRLFELEKGEFHVTVAHNKAQPLSVYASGQVIQAVGTAFNVELKDDQVELIVTDGQVLVAATTDQIKHPLLLDDVHLPQTALAVSKGEKIALGANASQVEQIDAADIDASLAWQQGSLIFRGESLAQAMKEVSRYTGYEFELLDEPLKHIKIAGLFKTDDVNGLLTALEQNFDVHHQRVSPNKIQLSSKLLEYQ